MSAAPTQPVISATGGDTTVTIALTSGGTGATSYDLKWGTAAGSRPNTISGVTLPYTHTGRTNGTTYYYSLVATNAGGSTESAEVSAAAMAASAFYSDNFNRANGGLGSNWTTAAGMSAPTVTSNGAGGVANAGAYWSDNTFADRQWAKMQCYSATFTYQTDALDTPTGGPMVRINGNAGYFPSVNNYDDNEGSIGFVVTLWRRGGAGTSYTRLTSYYESYSTDEYTWIRITADGSTIKVFGSTSENGTYTELISATDSTTASGAAGFVRPSNINGLDNWSGGDL